MLSLVKYKCFQCFTSSFNFAQNCSWVLFGKLYSVVPALIFFAFVCNLFFLEFVNTLSIKCIVVIIIIIALVASSKSIKPCSTQKSYCQQLIFLCHVFFYAFWSSTFNSDHREVLLFKFWETSISVRLFPSGWCCWAAMLPLLILRLCLFLVSSSISKKTHSVIQTLKKDGVLTSELEKELKGCRSADELDHVVRVLPTIWTLDLSMTSIRPLLSHNPWLCLAAVFALQERQQTDKGTASQGTRPWSCHFGTDGNTAHFGFRALGQTRRWRSDTKDRFLIVKGWDRVDPKKIFKNLLFGD